MLAYKLSFYCSWVSLDSEVFRQLPGYLGSKLLPSISGIAVRRIT